MSTSHRAGGLRRTYLTDETAYSGPLEEADVGGGLYSVQDAVQNGAEGQLTVMVEKIQAQLIMVLEKLLSLSKQMEVKPEMSRDQAEYYQDTVWPLIVQTAEDLDWLVAQVRDGIDSCTIDERKLSVLLGINKFNLQAQDTIDYLVKTVDGEVETLLELRERGICGIAMRHETLSALKSEHLRLKPR